MVESCQVDEWSGIQMTCKMACKMSKIWTENVKHFTDATKVILLFSVPKRKFPSSSEFREFRELKYQISNSGIPVSFSGLSRDGKWPVPNGGTETVPGRGCS